MKQYRYFYNSKCCEISIIRDGSEDNLIFDYDNHDSDYRETDNKSDNSNKGSNNHSDNNNEVKYDINEYKEQEVPDYENEYE
ncbi:15789_t:CDS:2 [Funneliformis mosseae]|uniref:15789_t:CDS:1 n=1 Tax=Funneliformis mosseae TaxID=27381 RepID=A0A9N9AIS5_FUNMO|nr:15789_t:CDS:2 [Funneliformis mosseae]